VHFYAASEKARLCKKREIGYIEGVMNEKTMQKILEEQLQQALKSLQSDGGWPVFEGVKIEVTTPKSSEFGDYTTNIAMALVKQVGKSPMEIAEMIKETILKSGDDKNNTDIEKIEVVRPGYINFYLSQNFLQSRVKEILSQGEQYGQGEEKKEKVMVEYSQPNTHKEFHIGHLRNVFIGSSIVNVLRKSGYQTLSANYFGDTGTHIAKCLWGLQKFHSQDNLDAIENKAEFLGKVYTEASQAIAEQPEYEEDFKAVQRRFDEGDPELVALWEKTKQWSLDEFNRIYTMFGVSFDVLFYESVEERDGRSLLPELLEKGIVEKSDGAIIANLEAYNLGVLVLMRRDGGILYGLKDIPLAKKKFEEFGIDRSIYVIDIRQMLYLKQLFKILELYGFTRNMQHIEYDFVSLKGGESMSSRKGNIIQARVLIEEVTQKVSKQFPEAPNVSMIALGAIRFAMLKYSSTSKIEFDMDESVRLDGSTGPYAQYAYARIASILAKAQEQGIPVDDLQKVGLKISESKELDLIRELMQFPKLVAEIAEDYQVHKLPHYALRVADRFHSFYAECRVIDVEQPELTQSRLALVRATQIVLAETLRLIGVSAPDRM